MIRSDKDGYFITRRRRFESVPVLIEAFMLNEGDDIPFMLSYPLPRVSPVVFSRYEGVVYPLHVEIDTFEIGEKVRNSELWDGEFNGNKVSCLFVYLFTCLLFTHRSQSVYSTRVPSSKRNLLTLSSE